MDGNALYYDYGYTAGFIYQNSSNCTLKIGEFCIYFNSVSLILKANCTGLVKLSIKDNKLLGLYFIQGTSRISRREEKRKVPSRCTRHIMTPNHSI